MDYSKRINTVLSYLEAHCCEDISLEDAARVANLSSFHFHRIFKSIVGETVAAYTRRLRYEKAAQSLLFDKKSVTETAMTFGFSSSQAMAKAFQNYFGVTPTQIRHCQTFEQYSVLMKNSKIGSKLHKHGYELPMGLSYAEFTAKHSGRTEMKTALYEKRTIAYVRVTGPYGENYEPAINQLYLWAGARNLDGECLFLYRDNPEITPTDKCRTDIAMVVPEETAEGKGICIEEIPAGGYAVLRKTVEHKAQYGQYWNQLMEEIVRANIDLEDRPCFEIYHSYDDQTGVADVSFCEPIRM